MDNMYNTENFLKDIHGAKKAQYLMLREAIWKHMEAQRNISIFSVTTVLAFYTIVFSMNVTSPYIFLIPVILLIPFADKELDHKISISYLVGYQIVCLENNRNVAEAFTWETDFFLFKRRKYDDEPHVLFKILLDSEFFIMGLISCGLYGLYFFSYSFNKQDIWCGSNMCGYIFGLFSVGTLIIIWKITKEYNLYVKSNGYYIKKWLKYMLDEGRIDLDTYDERYKELIGEEPKHVS
ncbi:MAG: hypothetical protein HDQ96_02625 [Lachnospiraceae bacterium]|nr:hypothetical protein [Lachnospiraceae bacterium]